MLGMGSKYCFLYFSQSYSAAVVAVYFFAVKFPLISQYTYIEYATCYRAEIQGILREKEMLKGNWSHTGRVEKGSSLAKEGSERNVEVQEKLKVDQNRTNGGRKDENTKEKEKRGL